MSQYNVIALESLKTTSDIENRTIVCGTLLTTGATFANQVNNPRFSQLDYSLEINGATTSGNDINVIVGSVALGPSSSARFVKNRSTQYTVDGHITFNINGGNDGAIVKIDPTLPERCAGIKASIEQLSATLSQLPANNNATFPTSRPGPLRLIVVNVDANGVAVFDLPASSVLNNDGSIQQIELIPQNTNLQFVVINLHGQTVVWSGSNLVGSWFDSVTLGRSHTIWNFPEATKISFDANLKGAVLAPYATLVTNVNIDGAVAVKSLDTRGEVHNPPIAFPTCIPTPTQTTAGE